MKKAIKYLILAALAALTCFTAASCSQWDTPYVELAEKGYNVSVKFDANGGVFAGTKDVYIIDVFNLDKCKTNESGMKEISLLLPNDANRKDRAFEVSKTDYFLAGWYSERSLRVDENGNALDDYGVKVSESGRPQGYVYSGKWNFDSDKLKLDPSKTYNANDSVLTLYAAWIPYFNFEFYAEKADGQGFELLSTHQMIELKVPVWNEETGRLDMFKFPEREGMTFDGAYLTEQMTELVSDKISGTVDYDKGIISGETVKIYTKWKNGQWFKIKTPKQFYENSRLDGNYEILADLDFSNTVWSPTLSKGEFKGTIIGNGHKFTNINVIQADNTQMNGGLFGKISSSAVFDSVSFENVSYTIQAGARIQGSSFGLLSGNIAEGAKFTNVNLVGTLMVSPKCYPQPDYLIGLICGNCSNTDGITASVNAKITDEASDVLSITTDSTSGRVTVTFK